MDQELSLLHIAVLSGVKVLRLLFNDVLPKYLQALKGLALHLIYGLVQKGVSTLCDERPFNVIL